MQVENLSVLATVFGEALRALALTCDDLRSFWLRSNLPASRHKCFAVWPPNPSQRKLFNNLLANEIQDFGRAGQSQ